MEPWIYGRAHSVGRSLQMRAISAPKPGSVPVLLLRPMMPRDFFRYTSLAGMLAALGIACSGAKVRDTVDDTPGPGGLLADGGAEGGRPSIGGRDPVNCQEAAQFRTYVGCDYWPTVLANGVQPVFDFAAVVANVGSQTANVTVTGPNGVNEKISVNGGELGKIYLPWVTALKGPQDGTGNLENSVLEKGGAYHLVSDTPVVVYQFNPLQFKAAGGAPGKDWSSCVIPPLSGATECYSYSNDASLLLPSTAMTGNYRVMGSHGFSRPGRDIQAPYFAVTATEDGTTVEVKLGPNAKVVAGGGIPAGEGVGTVTFALDAGDVAQVLSGVGRSYDLSGSLVKANKPVQVISGVPCIDFPFNVVACDHIEETVFPVETMGKHYVVPRPSGPNGEVDHVVHFFGNFDATALTYTPSKPEGCPDFLNAGQTADCGEVSTDFEVTGDKEFGVAMFLLGGSKVDPGRNEGDPSQSFAVTVEQYRKNYVFLAPSDYKKNFVDVVAGAGTSLTLDGADVSGQLKTLTGTKFLVARLPLGPGKDGAHTLSASAPVGIQVLGYGDYTSYQYPGGLNLSTISSVPIK